MKNARIDSGQASNFARTCAALHKDAAYQYIQQSDRSAALLCCGCCVPRLAVHCGEAKGGAKFGPELPFVSYSLTVSRTVITSSINSILAIIFQPF